ncbi:MAG: hypothetical protein H6618_06665 [Deltaproteobacteria bacterium]|nr:hypothetical protein [Deltaproteobacteria bacterium]
MHTIHIRAVKERLLIFLILTMLHLHQAEASSGPQFREDLTSPFNTIVCNKAASLDHERLWQAGLNEAGLTLRILEASAVGSLSEKKVRTLAKAMAVRADHRSWSFGLCNQKTGWVLSSPLPAPVSLESKRSQTLKILSKYCQSWHVDFAPSDHGYPEQLSSSREKAPSFLAGKRSGMISLSCLPKEPTWSGEELWLLYPLKQGQRSDSAFPVPEWAESGTEQDLTKWINRVRGRHGLPVLNFSEPQLHQVAADLTISGLLRHDKQQMKEAEMTLRKHSFDFLGENRVIAYNPESMARLFWLSPRHRGLLLNKEARFGGIAQAPDRNLLVFIAARESRKPPLAVRDLADPGIAPAFPEGRAETGSGQKGQKL